jgi:hypothetical protein
MHRSFWLGLMALVFVYGLQPGAVAQDKPAEKSAVAPSSGPRAEFLNELKGESDKFVRLAQAIPADKYHGGPAPTCALSLKCFCTWQPRTTTCRI